MQNIKERLSSQYVFHRLSGILFLVILFTFLYKVTIPRIGAFGCFDDCFNIGAGYLLSTGKKLYSEIFFNHQPLAAYFSWIIQEVAQPISLYELIKRHREFMLLWAFGWNIVFIIRFGFSFTLFSFVFELTKPFAFGERFLAEGMLVYPCIFVFTALWNSVKRIKNTLFDSVFVIIASVLIILLREPFIPIGSFFLIFYLVTNWKQKYFTVSAVLTVLLIFVTFIGIPWGDYWQQVVEINTQVHKISESLTISEISFSFLYPLFIFGSRTLFGFIQQITIISLIIFSILAYRYTLSFKQLFIIYFVMGIVNLRTGIAGQMYYEAFHMIVWWGITITSLSLLIHFVYTQSKTKWTVLLFGLSYSISIVVLLINHPVSYLREKVNRQEEFTTNYATDFAYGELVKILKKSGDELFIDGANDLVYWQAGIVNSYKYGWYTSVMPRFNTYREARSILLHSRPPDFYMTFCQNRLGDTDLPVELLTTYTNILFANKPSCLFIRSENIQLLTYEQKIAIQKYGYRLADGSN